MSSSICGRSPDDSPTSTIRTVMSGMRRVRSKASARLTPSVTIFRLSFNPWATIVLLMAPAVVSRACTSGMPPRSKVARVRASWLIRYWMTRVPITGSLSLILSSIFLPRSVFCHEYIPMPDMTAPKKKKGPKGGEGAGKGDEHPCQEGKRASLLTVHLREAWNDIKQEEGHYRNYEGYDHHRIDESRCQFPPQDQHFLLVNNEAFEHIDQGAALFTGPHGSGIERREVGGVHGHGV